MAPLDVEITGHADRLFYCEYDTTVEKVGRDLLRKNVNRRFRESRLRCDRVEWLQVRRRKGCYRMEKDVSSNHFFFPLSLRFLLRSLCFICTYCYRELLIILLSIDIH